jgi:capsular polysaccharide transport system permease protein
VNIRPAVALARIRPRHRLLVASFALVVLLPILIAAAYLWGKAADQYASTVGFSVRREEAGSAMEMLGGLTGLTKSSSSDTDILYEYLRSQKLVADLDAKLNLRAIWSKPQGDPYFAFNPSGSVEDLLDYWQGMVSTSYDGSTGLIEVRVLAFDPADATRIATAVLDESARMINDLGAAAREDGVRFSREELDEAEDRLRSAREAITAFRVKNQIVDPTTDFQAQAGLVASLENQLASAQIEIDLLGDMASGDPRLLQAKRRVEVIETRIAAERAKVGVDTGVGQKDYAVLASDYERLAVDREFAERAYVASLAAYDTARAESQRTSRYLAPHILPTTAEVSRFPERLSILGLLALGLILAWSVTALMAYSLKDRR